MAGLDIVGDAIGTINDDGTGARLSSFLPGTPAGMPRKGIGVAGDVEGDGHGEHDGEPATEAWGEEVATRVGCVGAE